MTKGGVKASCERSEHRRGVSNHHGRARAELKKGGVETTCRPAAAYKIDPFLPISPKISPAARCCGGRTTRAVRSCCKNVGCSTISRILTFAHGLAGRGVSNHVITGRQGRGVLQPGASAARAGRGVSKHRASEASAEGGGQCVCRKTPKSVKSVGPFHPMDSLTVPRGTLFSAIIHFTTVSSTQMNWGPLLRANRSFHNEIGCN